MNAPRSLFAVAFFLAACSAQLPIADAGTPAADGGQDAGPGCAATAESTAVLGAWHFSGTVTKNGSTWPASFPITVTNGPGCSGYVATDGDCAFSWTVTTGGASPTLALAAAPVRCLPGTHTVFTFDNMPVFDGMTDPFPGTQLVVTLDTGAMSVAGSTMSVNGTGTLGAVNSGTEPMTYSFTATR